MTRRDPCHWKHGGLKIAVALILMGFLPACDHAGDVSAPHSAQAGAGGKREQETFKVRHAIFVYRARSDRQHPYDRPVIEKHVVVLT